MPTRCSSTIWMWIEPSSSLPGGDPDYVMGLILACCRLLWARVEGYLRKALSVVRTIVGRWKPTGRWRIRARECWMSSSCRS
jgi:hypothetical protein